MCNQAEKFNNNIRVEVELPEGLNRFAEAAPGILAALQRQGEALRCLDQAVRQTNLEGPLREVIDQAERVERAAKELEEIDSGVLRQWTLDFFERFGQAISLMLRRNGVQKIDQVDVPFDPDIHEVISIEGEPGPNYFVKQVRVPGYRLNGRVLRIAQVHVIRREVL